MPVDIRKNVFTQSARRYLSTITGYCPIQLFYNVRGYFWGWMTINATLSPLNLLLRRWFMGFHRNRSCGGDWCLLGRGMIRWLHSFKVLGNEDSGTAAFYVGNVHENEQAAKLPKAVAPAISLLWWIFNWATCAWRSTHNLLKLFVRTCHGVAHSEQEDIQHGQKKPVCLTSQRHYWL